MLQLAAAERQERYAQYLRAAIMSPRLLQPQTFCFVGPSKLTRRPPPTATARTVPAAKATPTMTPARTPALTESTTLNIT
jgi:hypothetical protein